MVDDTNKYGSAVIYAVNFIMAWVSYPVFSSCLHMVDDTKVASSVGLTQACPNNFRNISRY